MANEVEVSTEWGVVWDDGRSAVEFEPREDERDARMVASDYAYATLVSRTVTRSPWAVAE